MKFFRLFRRAFLLLIGIAPLWALSPDILSQSTAPRRFINPTDEEFPILAYHAFKKPELISENNYKILKECGFNIALGWVTDTAYMSKVLQIGESVGIKILINTPKTKNATFLPDIVRHYDNYSSTAGYVLFDEPVESQFKEVKKLVNEVVNISDKLAYVNALPNYAPLKTLEAISYRRYLNDYAKIINPQFLSYDNYCIIEKDNKLSLRPGYFENLEIGREVSIARKIPLWTFCLSSAHYDYPVPDEGQLLFEAFTSIAYGSKGIQYYGYATDVFGAEKTAPVDQQGNRRELWYIIQKVNRQIQTVGRLLLNCESRNVWHTGAELPTGTKALHNNELPGPFTSIVSGSKGVVVGHLSDGVKDYLLIVNKDFEHSQRVRVLRQRDVKRINQNGQEVLDRASQINLKPGAWCMYTW